MLTFPRENQYLRSTTYRVTVALTLIVFLLVIAYAKPRTEEPHNYDRCPSVVLDCNDYQKWDSTFYRQ